ncbi:MAG: hypothetical protein DME25_00400 [Verrucomicrobia bacterium]|nr:MAG: hypothetical protein DME25_00400 [Verrucomicrobiota bacterium]
MSKILIVEDDQIVANIYRNKFSVDGFQVEVALDGQAGLEMARSFRPDAVILDLMLPKMTGVDLMKQLRAEPDFGQLPVIVFSNTYLTNMVQEAWKAGATKCLSKAGANGASAPKPTPPAQAAPKAAVPRPTAAAPAAPVASADSDAEFQSELREACVDSLPGTLTALRASLQGLIKADNESVRIKQAQELYRRIHALTGNAAISGLHQIAQMSDALEALLKELYEKPKNMTASTLRTVASAIDFLAILFERGLGTDQQETPAAEILVVDDEAISRRAVTYALEKAKLKSVSVEDPQAAFELLSSNRFDLVFLDVDMPGMNGFELCSKLRTLPAHKKTPVVFVTSLNDFESRANSTMSGGNDLIAKPFLFIELGVKALVYIQRARLGVAK